MKKNKNTSGGVKPALKSRTVIGIICIILALAVTVGIGPLVNKITEKTAEVVQVKRDVERGHVITEEDLEIVRVGSYNLSDKVLKDKKDAVGKYAFAALRAGQLLLSTQLTEGGNSASEVLGALNGSQLAVSVHIASFEEGLSGKLENGDVVSLIVYDNEEDKSFISEYLRYMQVVTTTTNDGIDSDTRTEDTGKAVSVTLLASPMQAELLAYYNSTSEIHFALVCRGDHSAAAGFLQTQAEYLASHPTVETNEVSDNG